MKTVGCEMGETENGARDEKRERRREQRTGAKMRLRTKDGYENETESEMKCTSDTKIGEVRMEM